MAPTLPRYDGGRRHRRALLARFDALPVTRRDRLIARAGLLILLAATVVGWLVRVPA